MRLRPESLGFTLLLSALGGVTPLSIDMGLPALVAIGDTLRISPTAAGLTLSYFLAGFALGPMALGPLSDRYGRRPILLGGTALFTAASLGCTLAHALPPLLFWRLVEGLGAGAGSTLSLAIVRDLFDGAAARVKLSYVGTVGTLAPMIAPTLGTIVLALAGWRAIYGTLAAGGILLLAVIALGFTESLRRLDPTALEPRRLAANYGRVLRHPLCLGYALVASLNFGCMFSYIASSPLIMLGVLKVSPNFYGSTFALTALGIMGGAFVNGRLNARGIAPRHLLTFGLTTSVLSALALLLVALLGWAHLGVILPLLVLNTFAVGFISPNASQAVMHPVPDIAGVASAVMGTMRMIAGAVASALIAVFYDGHTTFAMATMMTLFAVASLLVYLIFIRPVEKRALPDPVEEVPPVGDSIA